MSVVLHWFRSDLRVHDNRALAAAQAQGPVVGLYIATPEQWQLHDDAPVKLDFWRRNLHGLQQQLAALGIPLLYAQAPLFRDIPALLETLLPALQVKALYCNREYPVNELQRDAAVAALCRALGIAWQVCDDQLLVAPEAISNKSGLPFKVFTPYARAMRQLLQQSSVAAAAPLHMQVQPVVGSVSGLLPLEKLAWPQPEAHWAQLWPAGETAARKQLAHFCLERIADYREQRDLPAIQGTSRLSPLLAAGVLAAGVLSPRECWRTSSQWQEGDGVLTWQNELLWRDFYKHIMWHFPHVCRKLPWRSDMGHVPWRHDEGEFTAWCEGRTGIPLVDAAMRQLLQTGWMHNRLRMVSAMFLTRHLLIDWHWGERWFMQHLVDGDFAANNGGWQWSASTGTDAQPYFRIFNPVSQSLRFDPQGTFIRQFVPELAGCDARSIHDPGLLRPADYPAPLVDLAFGRERALNAFKRR